ncbi:MAG: hypothetical protein UU87_C0003G0042 [Parcubacteria group bacterium GW2011_GWA2_42_11]|nr:MAG: hypothetical protein UU87_C0003G0042 [Parcubacteria group bacterium GW2011_GWA2_42_11]
MPEENQPPAQENPSDNRSPESKETPGPEPASFPWMMFFVAALFDLIGLVPILNFFTEILAGLIFGFWQKMYNPKLDPVLTFIVAKIIDAISLGIMPSNIGIVIYAYIKKKAAAKLQTPIGQKLAGKIAK